MSPRFKFGEGFSVPQEREFQLMGSWMPVTPEKSISTTNPIQVDRYGNPLGRENWQQQPGFSGGHMQQIPDYNRVVPNLNLIGQADQNEGYYGNSIAADNRNRMINHIAASLYNGNAVSNNNQLVNFPAMKNASVPVSVNGTHGSNMSMPNGPPIMNLPSQVGNWREVNSLDPRESNLSNQLPQRESNSRNLLPQMEFYPANCLLPRESHSNNFLQQRESNLSHLFQQSESNLDGLFLQRQYSSHSLQQRESNPNHLLQQRESNSNHLLQQREYNPSHLLQQRESNPSHLMQQRESNPSHLMQPWESNPIHLLQQRESNLSHLLLQRESNLSHSWLHGQNHCSGSNLTNPNPTTDFIHHQDQKLMQLQVSPPHSHSHPFHKSNPR